MSRAIRFLFIAGIVVVGIVVLVTLAGGSRSRNALAKYKAELRAKGEKLSGAELGYPRSPESSNNLNQLQTALAQVKRFVANPGAIELMHFVTNGRARVVWAVAEPTYSWMQSGKTFSNSATWEEFSEQFESAADAMQEIREATENPPRWFYHDPTNLVNRPTSPFIVLRNAGQTLMGDAIAALHAQDLGRAQSDIHALGQLAQFNREDYTLVSQMIRTALTGLGLTVTWEALQAQGWSEEKLGAMQKDWEAVDLSDAFEKGITGERAFGEDFLSHMLSTTPHERAKHFNRVLVSGRHPLENFLVEFVALPYWRTHSEEDELFYIQQLQKSLDMVRQLQRGTNMNEINRQFKVYGDELNAAFSPPLAKFRYLYSSLALPNYIRATTTCVRNETQRRLTVTGIAIQRYHLRHGNYPPSLNVLVPEFLSLVPIDLMSTKPLGYKLNSDGGFTLYSVGEDGRDDAGDSSTPGVTNKFDLWSGKDAVWPTAVFENPARKN